MKKEEGQKKEARAIAPRQGGEVFPRWERDIDRMFEEMWRRPFPSLLSPFPSLWDPFRARPSREVSLRAPAVDVYEDRDDVVAKAELPGLSKEDLEVNLTGSTLTITGEKKKEEDVKEDEYAYSERAYGKFTRRLELPFEVKSDEVKATFKNGVLEIRLPKTEEAKKRQYTVKIE